MDLLKSVLNPRNLITAQQRVMSNRGAPGVDGMKVKELPEFMRKHKADVITAVINGTYQPQSVRGIEPSHDLDLNIFDTNYYIYIN